MEQADFSFLGCYLHGRKSVTPNRSFLPRLVHVLLPLEALAEAPTDRCAQRALEDAADAAISASRGTAGGSPDAGGAHAIGDLDVCAGLELCGRRPCGCRGE